MDRSFLDTNVQRWDPDSPRCKADGDAPGLLTDDVADYLGPVAVIFSTISGIDCRVCNRLCLVESDVVFDAAGADSAGSAHFRVAEPGVGRPVPGTNVEISSGSHDPDRDVWPKRSVCSPRRDLQLLGAPIFSSSVSPQSSIPAHPTHFVGVNNTQSSTRCFGRT